MRLTKNAVTIVFLGLLIIAGIALFVIALRFEAKAISTSTPGSRFFPLVTLSVVLILSITLVIQELRRGGRHSESNNEQLELTAEQITRIGLVAVASFVAHALWDIVGFLPMAFLLIAGLSIIVRIRSVWTYGIMAIAVTALYFAFDALNIPLN